MVDAGPALQGLGCWCIGRLGLLLILDLFSLPYAFPLLWVGFHGGADRFCLLLAGFVDFGKRQTLRQASYGVSRGRCL